MNPKFINLWVAGVVLAAGVAAVLMPFLPTLKYPYEVGGLWSLALFAAGVGFGGGLGSGFFHLYFRSLSRVQIIFVLASVASSGICYLGLWFPLRWYRNELAGLPPGAEKHLLESAATNAVSSGSMTAYLLISFASVLTHWIHAHRKQEEDP